MNISQLQYVLEIQRAGSITQAARNLFMSQPNLSKAVCELESELSFALFTRSSKGVVPTPRGREFLSKVKLIVEQIKNLEHIYKPDDEGRLSLRVSVPRASYISMSLTDFLKDAEYAAEMAVYFRETDSMSAIEDVSAGTSDLGIIRYQNQFEDYFINTISERSLTWEPLCTFTPLILLSQSHPLAGFDTIPLHMLYEYPEVVHGDAQIPTAEPQTLNYFGGLKLPSKRIYITERGSQMDLLQFCPNTYMWVSPVPQELLSAHHLAQRPTVPCGVQCRDVLVTPKSKHFRKCESRFIEAVNARQISSSGTV